MTEGKDFLKLQLETMAPHRALLRSIESKFMSSVPLLSPSLDIGCGEGHFASIAYDSPIDIGLDPLASDLSEAHELVPATYRILVLASATRLPFPDDSFQTIVSNSVIEHIPDIDAVVHEISRVLRPGGVFATTMPSEYFPEYLLGSTIGRKIGSRKLSRAYGEFFNRISYHYNIDPPDVWVQRFEAVGLSVDDHCYYFSPQAHRAFDAAHYLGIPNLIAKKTMGRWVVHPVQARLLDAWYRRYYEEELPERGAYQFFRCVKQ